MAYVIMLQTILLDSYITESAFAAPSADMSAEPYTSQEKHIPIAFPHLGLKPWPCSIWHASFPCLAHVFSFVVML